MQSNTFIPTLEQQKIIKLLYKELVSKSTSVSNFEYIFKYYTEAHYKNAVLLPEKVTKDEMLKILKNGEQSTTFLENQEQTEYSFEEILYESLNKRRSRLTYEMNLAHQMNLAYEDPTALPLGLGIKQQIETLQVVYHHSIETGYLTKIANLEYDNHVRKAFRYILDFYYKKYLDENIPLPRVVTKEQILKDLPEKWLENILNKQRERTKYTLAEIYHLKTNIDIENIEKSKTLKIMYEIFDKINSKTAYIEQGSWCFECILKYYLKQYENGTPLPEVVTKDEMLKILQETPFITYFFEKQKQDKYTLEEMFRAHVICADNIEPMVEFILCLRKLQQDKSLQTSHVQNYLKEQSTSAGVAQNEL